MVPLVFCLWLAVGGFTLFQRQATSKSASTFLSTFRLLPRLEEVYIPWVHSNACRHASRKSGLPTRRLGW